MLRRKEIIQLTSWWKKSNPEANIDEEGEESRRELPVARRGAQVQGRPLPGAVAAHLQHLGVGVGSQI